MDIDVHNHYYTIVTKICYVLIKNNGDDPYMVSTNVMYAIIITSSSSSSGGGGPMHSIECLVLVPRWMCGTSQSSIFFTFINENQDLFDPALSVTLSMRMQNTGLVWFGLVCRHIMCHGMDRFSLMQCLYDCRFLFLYDPLKTKIYTMPHIHSIIVAISLCQWYHQ